LEYSINSLEIAVKILEQEAKEKEQSKQSKQTSSTTTANRDSNSDNEEREDEESKSEGMELSPPNSREGGKERKRERERKSQNFYLIFLKKQINTTKNLFMSQ